MNNIRNQIYNESRKQRDIRYYINAGLGWNVAYHFDLAIGATAYLAFAIGNKRVHANSRLVRIIGLDNALIDCRITTLKNATVDTLGNDITATTLFNADLNLVDDVSITVYDETTTITDEGVEAPFSSRIRADRRSSNAEYITNEYIFKKNGIRVLKFENLGAGIIEVEYSSSGYQEIGDER